jgi:tetratricopeptide (TPR) repeat protein
MAANSNNKVNMNEIKNPIWLKDKGDELMNKGEYLGAINAYKTAFKLAPSELSALSNLSLAHLYMFNYNESHLYSHMVIQAIDDLPNEDKIIKAPLKLKNQVR